MTGGTYDIITVGGGLGGAALAKAMAEHGARVLVLERETQFKDRVRGEQMTSWGVGEARTLGIYELLRDACGHEVRWWQTYLGGVPLERQDCVAESVQHAPQFMFYHPAMQEVLLQAAADAGATVCRGMAVRDVRPGTPPTVLAEQHGRTEELRARLVVGVDGRTSMVRKWAGFAVHRDPPQGAIPTFGRQGASEGKRERRRGLGKEASICFAQDSNQNLSRGESVWEQWST